MCVIMKTDQYMKQDILKFVMESYKGLKFEKKNLNTASRGKLLKVQY